MRRDYIFRIKNHASRCWIHALQDPLPGIAALDSSHPGYDIKRTDIRAEAVLHDGDVFAAEPVDSNEIALLFKALGHLHVLRNHLHHVHISI